MRPLSRSLFALSLFLGTASLLAQTPAAPAKPAAPAEPVHRMRPSDYPERAAGDPVKIAHGKQLFSANCSFCHGSDARGGETGTNLVRSQLVLDDQHGELITPVVQNGRIPKGMPSFPLKADDISDIAAFIHSQKLATQGHTESAPINILVGDADAGKAYFDGPGKCAKCHSVTGDLAGIGARLEPKALQNALVSGVAPASPGHRPQHPEITANITLPSGQKAEGKLVFRDAFFVSIIDADGNHRSFPADAPRTKIEVHNPLQTHLDMLATWKDSDIHNLTKYLSTLK